MNRRVLRGAPLHREVRRPPGDPRAGSFGVEVLTSMQRPEITGRVGRISTSRSVATRRSFLASAGALGLFASVAGLRGVARATGGLDVGDAAERHDVRVLLATGAYPPATLVDAWHFAWNDRTYRGTFATVRLPDGRDGLVNVVPLDAYLYGVLSSEVSASWAASSQQAQAIVSRTYALDKLRPGKPFDVTAGDVDQHYGGIESETVEGRAAVDATAGVIATFDARPAHVAYSACCGGRTAAAGDVWSTPYAYLPSIADPHCVGTPNFSWQVDVATADLRGALSGELATIGSLRSVQLIADAPQDRPRAIAFVGDTTIETPVAAFRSAVGASVVRSTFVRAASYDAVARRLSLSGTGRGHGVGMCQWGARVLGDAGASAQAIVAFYFPGTSCGRA